jgi:small subunit ribosomal protein S16
VAVKIRLLRVGKTKQPSYRVVVADSRSPRDGRIIETIGHYGPRAEPSRIQINEDRALAWLRQGAQPTEQVQKLLTVAGVWGTYAAERKGPIVTKLNRRGFVTGRGPQPAPAAAPEPAAAKPAAKPAAPQAAPEAAVEAPAPEPAAADAPAPEPAAEAPTDAADAAEATSEEPSA